MNKEAFWEGVVSAMSTKAERDAMRGVLSQMNEFTPAGRTIGLLELISEIDECKAVIRKYRGRFILTDRMQELGDHADKLLEGEPS